MPHESVRIAPSSWLFTIKNKNLLLRHRNGTSCCKSENFFFCTFLTRLESFNLAFLTRLESFCMRLESFNLAH